MKQNRSACFCCMGSSNSDNKAQSMRFFNEDSVQSFLNVPHSLNIFIISPLFIASWTRSDPPFSRLTPRSFSCQSFVYIQTFRFSRRSTVTQRQVEKWKVKKLSRREIRRLRLREAWVGLWGQHRSGTTCGNLHPLVRAGRPGGPRAALSNGNSSVSGNGVVKMSFFLLFSN